MTKEEFLEKWAELISLAEENYDMLEADINMLLKSNSVITNYNHNIPSMIGSIVKFKTNQEKILEGIILDRELCDNLYYLIQDTDNNLRLVLAGYITEIVKQVWK